LDTSFSSVDATAVPPELAELRAFIVAWYEYAVLVGFIRRNYVLDEETAERLRLYFHAGLTPGESAGVIFATLH
jgi:hypothetical protein